MELFAYACTDEPIAFVEPRIIRRQQHVPAYCTSPVYQETTSGKTARMLEKSREMTDRQNPSNAVTSTVKYRREKCVPKARMSLPPTPYNTTIVLVSRRIMSLRFLQDSRYRPKRPWFPVQVPASRPPHLPTVQRHPAPHV